MITSTEAIEQRDELTRQRARETVQRVFRANHGKPDLEICFALGAASACFNGVREKRIWSEEIRQYRQEHGL